MYIHFLVGGQPFTLQPLVEFLAIEIQLFPVRAEVGDLAIAGELVQVALAHFEVEARFFEGEDFFLKEGLAGEQFFNPGQFFQNVSLAIHRTVF